MKRKNKGLWILRYGSISRLLVFISPCLCLPVLPVLISILFFISYFQYPAYAQASDPVIKKIDVKGLTRVEKEELIDLICFGVGDTLDRQTLSKGIRRAFKKGIFYDIQAVAEPYNGGIKLTYIIEEVPIVDNISVRGNEHFSSRTIRKNFYYKEGEEFREEFLGRARLALLEFYKRKGFPDAEIKITVNEAKEKARVNIHINIIEGQPLIIKKIKILTEAKYLIKVSEGDIFDRDRVDKDIERLREHYKEKNYIKPVIGPYQFRDGELSIPVDPGMRLEVTFKNNKALSKRELEEELPFIENEEVTDELIAETAERIKQRYMSKGYYYAQVAAGVEKETDIIRLTYIIYEGERVILKKINFAGISISHDAVKKVIPLKENKPFDSSLLSDSRESLIRFYNALGYLQAEVVDIKKDFKNDGRELYLEFIVSEGVQTRIEGIKVIGNKQLSISRILDVLKLKEGAPYNVVDIGDARHSILALYNRYGYMDATVEVESVIDRESAFLTFKIEENSPSVIGKIILRGNQKTKAKIIIREFTLEEGDTYNSDEIIKIKQRLYSLGIFNEISISALDPGEEKDGKVVKDMLVSVKEGNAGAVEVTLGYGDYEKFRGSLDISYRNLGGYNRQIGLHAELSSVEQRYTFNFREPWLFNQPNVPLKIFLIREERRALNIETREVLYKIDKQSFIAGVEKEIVQGLKVGFDYEYSFTDTKDVKEDVILSKEDQGTLGIGSISPSLFYDTRDNPFDPTSGSLYSIVLKYASVAFLSETEFLKGTFQTSWYFPLMKRIVLAFALRGGAAYGFEESEEIPLIERFFLGGRTTVRGYRHDTLGPRGVDDNPTGGNVFALTNWELRFSLGKGFGLVTFIDAGNVWKTLDEVDDELKYTVGAGLRYSTPVGPIRIDYGHKMNKEHGESSGEVHFSFGHAF